MIPDQEAKPRARPATQLAVAALGVVFGDIGTSPLYTLKACFDFSGAHPIRPYILGRAIDPDGDSRNVGDRDRLLTKLQLAMS